MQISDFFDCGHWFDRMLSPASIAIVGASDRPGRPGNMVQRVLQAHGFAGDIWPVNPNHDRIGELVCYPDLSELPSAPDLVVVVVNSSRVEVAVQVAIDIGSGGIVIFSNNFIEQDVVPPLLERLKTLCRNADIPVCGGNGMGFYNYDSHALVSFDSPPERPSGYISLIAHSGSVMTYLANTDPRLMFNLVVSPGQEIHGTVADYIQYALHMPSTRVIAVFIETIRDPEGFVLALSKAREIRISVVIVKVGATEQSARMAASHSGAIAGDDNVFQAICDRYGAIRVRDIDELAATALLFSQKHRPGSGGLSSLLDSGGLREQMVDLASDFGVTFTRLSESSRNQLASILEYGLIPDNPVDAMGSISADVAETYSQCLDILGNDPGTAMLSLEFEFRDGFSHYPSLLEVAKKWRNKSDQSFIVINSTSRADNNQKALELGRCGIPVINGISLALAAIGNAFRYRDHRMYPLADIPSIPETAQYHEANILRKGNIEEAETLLMLSDFGLPVVEFRLVKNTRQVLEAAEELGYPVVLKSARPGLLHKSEVMGVITSIQNRSGLLDAYRELSARLGDEVIVAAMLGDGVELGFGMVNDRQFGPVVMVSAGGTHIELFDDRRFIKAPFSTEEAWHHIQSLKICGLLEGCWGRVPCRMDLAATALSRFSEVASTLKDCVLEMDANPVIVTPHDCRVADAMVVGMDGG